MHVYAAPRRGGKTHKLIELMRKNPNSIMICAAGTLTYARREYPEIADRLFPPNRERLLGWDRDAPIYVDNAEFLLQEFLGRMPTVATFTGQSENLFALDPWLRVEEGL